MATENTDPSLQQRKLKANQVINQEGGYVFKVNDVDRLSRLLIASQNSQEEIKEVVNKLIQNGRSNEVIQQLKDFSTQGRCCQRSSMVYCLAVCARYTEGEHSEDIRRAAYSIFPKLCCIPTYLFEFVKYCKMISKEKNGSGWGRAYKRAISEWYLKKGGEELAYYVTKYKRRNSWSHKDLLKLCHPKPSGDMKSHSAVFTYVTKGYDKMAKKFDSLIQDNELCKTLGVLYAVNKASHAENEEIIIELIKNHGLVHEQIPNRFLRNREVWAQLLKVGIPIMALIRNLGKLTEMRLFENEVGDPNNELLEKVCTSLGNEDHLCKARIHPLFILHALKVYTQGQRLKGSYFIDYTNHERHWEPNERIKVALENAFYKTLKCPMTPISKRCFIAIDVSESMFGDKETDFNRRNNFFGCSKLLPAEAAAAMTLWALQVPIDDDRQPVVMGFSDTIFELDIRKEMKLVEVVDKIKEYKCEGTDCALPMDYAREHDILVDNFIIFTDSETYSGDKQPFEALKSYRAHMRSNRGSTEAAKLIVWAMTSRKYTIADPEDRGMLEIHGFDLKTPQIIGELTSLKFSYQ